MRSGRGRPGKRRAGPSSSLVSRVGRNRTAPEGTANHRTHLVRTGRHLARGLGSRESSAEKRESCAKTQTKDARARTSLGKEATRQRFSIGREASLAFCDALILVPPPVGELPPYFESLSAVGPHHTPRGALLKPRREGVVDNGKKGISHRRRRRPPRARWAARRAGLLRARFSASPLSACGFPPSAAIWVVGRSSRAGFCIDPASCARCGAARHAVIAPVATLLARLLRRGSAHGHARIARLPIARAWCGVHTFIVISS